MSEEDIINLALVYQDKFKLTLANINKNIGELKYKFENLESKLTVPKSVNCNLWNKITTLERQCELITNIVDKNIWKFPVFMKTLKTTIWKT